MSVSVRLRQLQDGWNLVTVDELEDVLAGPFESKDAALQAAKELDLSIENLKPENRILTVADMKIGWLFHAGEYWYRLQDKGKSASGVAVIGQGRTEKLDNATEVYEISVTSLS